MTMVSPTPSIHNTEPITGKYGGLFSIRSCGPVGWWGEFLKGSIGAARNGHGRTYSRVSEGRRCHRP